MSISRRRLFLASASGVAGAAALAGAQAGRSPVRKAGISLPKNRLSPLDGVARENIKITGIKVMNLGYRLTPEEEWPDADNNVIIWKTESVIAVVSTDAGITGIGGCSRYNGPEEMRQYVETVIKPIILGKNPFDVEYLAGGISGPRARGVWAGIDTALWDIVGKAKGLPLYKLLATDTEPQLRLRAYASGGEFTWRKGSRFPGPEDLIKQALRHKQAGYTAFKFRPGGGFGRLGITIKDFIPYHRQLRQAVGPSFDLIQEANQRWSMDQVAEICPVLEELKFLWFEEPVRKNIDNYVKIKKLLPTVKISGGETVPTRSELVEWMDRGAYDIVQPGCDDAGVTEAWYMARMAHTRGKLLCPHNWQDGLITAANAHLMAAVPNRFLLESNMTPNPFKEGLFKEKLAVKDGYLDVPTKPGLGVELKEGLEEQYPPLPGNWNRPDPDMPAG
jgi:L-alanine-DL-glutamate epimerase-like enolase superfamily enzyme